eukprot:TRINITY_DN3399_c0_g1_i4.p1 TRINITY_DN3399_c0_g1~~TRINITY_DN3399_c0_g1_i4.p1  ORF type:complete len:176 (-),score=27.13 TRINITY_DN3399_c0_g1_i4:104-631(-)
MEPDFFDSMVGQLEEMARDANIQNTETVKIESKNDKRYNILSIVYSFVYVGVQTWGMLAKRLHRVPWSPLVTAALAYASMLLSLVLTGLKVWCRSDIGSRENLLRYVTFANFFHGIFRLIFSIFVQCLLLVKGEHGNRWNTLMLYCYLLYQYIVGIIHIVPLLRDCFRKPSAKTD